MAASLLIIPSYLTCAKSRLLFKSLFAIRGVPLEREAISIAPFSSTGILSISALLLTIEASCSLVYISSLKITPNLSRRGAESWPALVVAPIRVKCGKSSLIDLAEGPLPIIISSAPSSIAG